MEKQYVTIKPKKDWIIILDQYLKKNKYGYEGDIIWRTERVHEVQRISSIHIEENSRFKALFEIKKGTLVKSIPNNHKPIHE